jgi:hypothetical protein
MSVRRDVHRNSFRITRPGGDRQGERRDRLRFRGDRLRFRGVGQERRPPGFLDFPLGNFNDTGAARQIGLGCRFFFGDADQVAFRLQASRLTEDTFDETSTHLNYVVGFTWRLGGGA